MLKSLTSWKALKSPVCVTKEVENRRVLWSVHILETVKRRRRSI